MLGTALFCGGIVGDSIPPGWVIGAPLLQGAVAHSTVVANGKTQEEVLPRPLR